jgi:site-specific recombinase XerD
MTILEAQHDFEALRAMLGHVQLETTQIYAQIRPAQLKRATAFYEANALDALAGEPTA